MRKKLVLEVILLITLILGSGVVLYCHFFVRKTPAEDTVKVFTYSDSDPNMIGITSSRSARAVWNSLDPLSQGRASYEKGTIEVVAQKYAQKEMGPYEIPQGLGCRVLQSTAAGCDVFTFIPKKGFDKTILYVHGGAYIMDITELGFRKMDEIAQKANARVIMPRYKTIFHGTYKEAYELFAAVYDSILMEEVYDSNRDPSEKSYYETGVVTNLTIMGESAGGGLALGFVEYLNEQGLPLPQKMLLLCPWVDASMTNPDISDYVERDILLGPYGLAYLGSLWADGIPLNDYHVSPIYGDFSRKMPDSLIVIGTEEVMYPDVTLLYSKLKNAGHRTRLIIGEDNCHVFMNLDTPEAEETWKLIYEFLSE